MKEQIVLDKIKEMLEERKRNRIEPLFVLNVKLFNSLNMEDKEYKEAIRNLIRQKKIVYGITLNDFYFKLK